MMAELTKNILESTFKQRVTDFLNAVQLLTVYDSLQLVIDFYKDYQVKGVDSTIPDNDMLLFEYGIYDWQDGKGENFTIDITRQFYVESEESDSFSQLHMVLYYNSEEFREIGSSNKWSFDFEDIEDWKNDVLKCEGFKKTEGKHPKTFDIFLSETD